MLKFFLIRYSIFLRSQLKFLKLQNCIYDVYKWLNDTDVEKAVLRISIVIWQTYQSNRENL